MALLGSLERPHALLVQWQNAGLLNQIRRFDSCIGQWGPGSLSSMGRALASEAKGYRFESYRDCFSFATGLKVLWKFFFFSHFYV